MGPKFLRTVFREGFLALPYLGGLPPARIWLQARKLPLLAGSVIIGPGAGEAQAKTLAGLRSVLPEDWETIVCADCDGGEPEAFNRAVPGSRGDVLWFLRAGTTCDGQLFQDLWDRVMISPAAPGSALATASGAAPGSALATAPGLASGAAPGSATELSNPGDVSGLMLRRTDAYVVGPLPRGFATAQIAYEDWLLRLEATGKVTYGVPGRFDVVPHEAADVAIFQAESAALMDKWSELEIDDSGLASADNPRCREHLDRPVPWAGREPRLSLCMITKNEEQFLGQCLASAAPVVDEIIVVDTGSTDRTVEIAESFGAKVLHYEWNDDFAAARNVARAAATGDWILSLDADEALRPAEHPALRQALNDHGVSGYHLKFKNHHTNADTVGVIMVRVFRNLEGVFWENRIHEQMTTSLVAAGKEQGLQLGIVDVGVDHYGYLDEVMESRGKEARNDRLFRAHLDEHPDDIYMLYKYGDFLRRTTSRWQESLGYLRRAFDRVCELAPCHRTEIPYASEIAALTALEYRRAGDGDLADRIIQTALRDFVSTPNLHYLAASLALLQQRGDEAVAHFQRCLAFRDQVLVVPIQEGITSYVSLTGIAQAYMQKGDWVRAKRLLEQSVRIEPSYEVSALMLSNVGLQQGDLSGALTTLTHFLEQFPDSPGVCQQAALFMKEFGYEVEAKAMADRAIGLLESRSLDFEANQFRETVFAEV